MQSSQLEMVVAGEWPVQKTEYYYKGKLTYAEDRHFASMIRSWAEIPEGSDAAYAVREEYFDENGSPVQQPGGHYGLLHEYDKQNRAVRSTWLGEEGEYIRNAAGYAILNRTFYEGGQDDGRVKEEYYYDEGHRAVALSQGQYGVRMEYDPEGRVQTLTYLGQDGKPTVTNAGYASVRRTFYPDNRVKTERYYGLDGKPARLRHGQYGVYLEYDQDGRSVVRNYLGRDGEPVFNLYLFLTNHLLVVVGVAILLVLFALRLGRKGNLALLGIYLVFIAYMTLMNRVKGDPYADAQVLWSYSQFFSSPQVRMEILDNIILFVPLGTILYRLRQDVWMLLIPVAVSVGIELVQYLTGRGQADAGDVVSNCLGGVLGFVIGYVVRKWVVIYGVRVEKNAIETGVET